MDHESCRVIYLDRRAQEERTWTSSAPPQLPAGDAAAQKSSHDSSGQDEVAQNIASLLSVFTEVTVYRTSTPCVAEIEVGRKDPFNSSPIIMLLDIPPGEESSSRHPRRESLTSPTSEHPNPLDASESENPYGMDFLQHLCTVTRTEPYGSQIIPVAVLSGSHENPSMHETQWVETGPRTPSTSESPKSIGNVDTRYLEAGAVDVMRSPFSVDRVRSLPAHAHHTSIDRTRRRSSAYGPSQGRRTSWVGTSDDKPYTHLKDKMVSELMDHIVDPEREESPLDPSVIALESHRQEEVATAFGSWSFSAHDMSDDELLYGVFRALDHALTLPELEKWRIDADQLIIFLLATRRVYNSSVLYHNFRHACDVLQATFCFLLATSALPTFPGDCSQPNSEVSLLGELIDPFYALVLLVSAVGHDVGHPGVNNGFLVTVKSPLAQLYNDRSVLESFHCAAYSQILRRYWKPVFEDNEIRRLMIKAILATDMGLHTEYMLQMAKLQKKGPKSTEELVAWGDKEKRDAKELLLCLLIKCADICNVARKFDVASHWAKILIDEFFAQGQIEKDMGVATSLFGGPPDPESLLQKCKSQIGFINVFGYPLFGGMAQVLPSMKFVVDELDRNRAIWEDTLKIESGHTSPRSAAEGAHMSVDANGQGVVHVSHVGEVGATPRVSVQLTAAMNAHAAYNNSRRASGGSTTSLFGASSFPVRDEHGRRSSLGPTVMPESVRTKKRQSIVRFA